MNKTGYLLIRKTPAGVIIAHPAPFPTQEQAGRALGMVLHDRARTAKSTALKYGAALAARPLGEIFEASGYTFRILAADYTVNDIAITPGLRVFNTDMIWGRVVPGQFMRQAPMTPGGKYFEGWYSVDQVDGKGEKDFNGERLTTDASRFNRPDMQQLLGRARLDGNATPAPIERVPE